MTMAGEQILTPANLTLPTDGGSEQRKLKTQLAGAKKAIPDGAQPAWPLATMAGQQPV